MVLKVVNQATGDKPCCLLNYFLKNMYVFRKKIFYTSFQQTNISLTSKNGRTGKQHLFHFLCQWYSLSRSYASCCWVNRNKPLLKSTTGVPLLSPPTPPPFCFLFLLTSLCILCLSQNVSSRSGLSEHFEVDGWVVKVSGQSRDILFKKYHP